MKQKESELVRAICDYLSLRKYFFWRSNNTPIYDPVGKKFRAMPKYTMRGIPDVIILKEGGVAVFLEAKTEKGVLSPFQKDFQEKCNQLKANYHIIKDVSQLKEIGL